MKRVPNIHLILGINFQNLCYFIWYNCIEHKEALLYVYFSSARNIKNNKEFVATTCDHEFFVKIVGNLLSKWFNSTKHLSQSIKKVEK
jgi:hypothetical protein